MKKSNHAYFVLIKVLRAITSIGLPSDNALSDYCNFHRWGVSQLPWSTRAHMMVSFIALHWKIARVVSMECVVNIYLASVPKEPINCQVSVQKCVRYFAILQSIVMTGVV